MPIGCSCGLFGGSFSKLGRKYRGIPPVTSLPAAPFRSANPPKFQLLTARNLRAKTHFRRAIDPPSQRRRRCCASAMRGGSRREKSTAKPPRRQVLRAPRAMNAPQNMREFGGSRAQYLRLERHRTRGNLGLTMRVAARILYDGSGHQKQTPISSWRSPLAPWRLGGSNLGAVASEAVPRQAMR